MTSISITLGNNITELTLINPIIPERLKQLEAVLAGIQAKIEKGEHTPIHDISTIHYARWAIIDHNGGNALLFASNFDGTWEKYLKDFSTKIPEGLDSIWGNCVGYPAGGCADFENFKAWVEQYQRKVNTFYAAYPEVTVKRVLAALKTKKLTDEYVRELSEI